ncbi:hypothetical protein NQZ68_033429 [Dissostichus eleginoides]|nr:hypothetical protein NQZ68_033429 [Dissostichus eleginoides]
MRALLLRKLDQWVVKLFLTEPRSFRKFFLFACNSQQSLTGVSVCALPEPFNNYPWFRGEDFQRRTAPGYLQSMAETTETRQSNEEMFANRFTSDDREYQQYLSRPADLPPIVEDWRSRGGGNRRGSRDRYQDRRGRGGGGGGWGGDRGWRGDNRGQQDRDRDRHSGHGSGYQSGPPSSNQGYNSYNQRPHYDRY